MRTPDGAMQRLQPRRNGASRCTATPVWCSAIVDREVPHIASTLHNSSHVLPCRYGSISASTGTSATVAVPISGMSTRPGHAVPTALDAAKASIGATSSAARSARNGRYHRRDPPQLRHWHSMLATAARAAGTSYAGWDCQPGLTSRVFGVRATISAGSCKREEASCASHAGGELDRSKSRHVARSLA